MNWQAHVKHRLAQAVAGTFSTTEGEDAADIPPTRPALDRRRERRLASALAAPDGTPKKLLLPPEATDDSSRHRIPRWFTEASDRNQLVNRFLMFVLSCCLHASLGVKDYKRDRINQSINRLVKEGREVEISTPRRRLKTPWFQPRGGGGGADKTCATCGRTDPSEKRQG
jgi:hypothetical protein